MIKDISIAIENGSLMTGGEVFASPFDTGFTIERLISDFNGKIYSSTDGAVSLYGMECRFIGLLFKFGIRMKEGRFAEFILKWKEGAAEKLGYEATQQDLSEEKKSLVSALQSHFGRKPDSLVKTTSKWNFSWGAVCVSYDIKSNDCAIFIEYGAG